MVHVTQFGLAGVTPNTDADGQKNSTETQPPGVLAFRDVLNSETPLPVIAQNPGAAARPTTTEENAPIDDDIEAPELSTDPVNAARSKPDQTEGADAEDSALAAVKREELPPPRVSHAEQVRPEMPGVAHARSAPSERGPSAPGAEYRDTGAPRFDAPAQGPVPMPGRAAPGNAIAIQNAHVPPVSDTPADKGMVAARPGQQEFPTVHVPNRADKPTGVRTPIDPARGSVPFETPARQSGLATPSPSADIAAEIRMTQLPDGQYPANLQPRGRGQESALQGPLAQVSAASAPHRPDAKLTDANRQTITSPSNGTALPGASDTLNVRPTTPSAGLSSGGIGVPDQTGSQASERMPVREIGHRPQIVTQSATPAETPLPPKQAVPSVDVARVIDDPVLMRDAVATSNAPTELAAAGRSFVQPSIGAERSIMVQIVHATPTPGQPAVEISLNPEELGRVKISLSGSENTISVTLSAERHETLELLRRHATELAQEYQAMGYAEVDFEFRQTDQNETSGSPARNAEDTTAIPPAPDPAAEHASMYVVHAGVDIRI